MGKNRIFFACWTPAIYWSLVSKPVSQDIQSICYCLHTGTFRLDTRDLLVAGVPISISSKYLYLYLELSGSTLLQGGVSAQGWGVSAWGEVCTGGVCPCGGCCQPGGSLPRRVSARHPQHIHRMTDTCENITLPWMVKIVNVHTGFPLFGTDKIP